MVPGPSLLLASADVVNRTCSFSKPSLATRRGRRDHGAARFGGSLEPPSIMSLESFEQRLNSLERQLGLANATYSSQDLDQRLSAVEARYQSLAHLGSFLKKWNDCQALQEELDPGTALTHQQQIAAPILYRRAEVLASAETFGKDLDQLSSILSLLLIGQQETSKNKITKDQIVHAPIVSSSIMPDETKKRLEALAVTILDLQTRVSRSTAQVDQILDEYHALAVATAEKTVLLDDELTRRGA